MQQRHRCVALWLSWGPAHIGGYTQTCPRSLEERVCTYLESFINSGPEDSRF